MKKQSAGFKKIITSNSTPIPPPDLRPFGPSAELNPPSADNPTTWFSVRRTDSFVSAFGGQTRWWDKSGGGTIYLFAATRWEVSPELYQLPNTHVVITGIGMKKAYQRISSLFLYEGGEGSSFTPLLLSLGFSGSTHESLRPYDIVLANTTYLITHSNGWQTGNEFRFPEGNLSSYHDTHFEQSRVVWGHIGSVPRPIWFPDTKENLGNSSAVCAIDMESCAVARTAQEHHLPFLAIRIILDCVKEPLFSWRPWAFPRRVSLARKILGKFIFEFLTHNTRRTTHNGI